MLEAEAHVQFGREEQPVQTLDLFGGQCVTDAEPVTVEILVR